MATLPRTCKHCGNKMTHYGACGECADSILDAIDAERKQIANRLDALKELEKAALKKMLIELGEIGV